jgi:D-3-phosphoglycerate dehydrogenase
VHAARGGIVDEQALAEVLTAGHLAGAALDVFEQEPLAPDSPLRRAPNLVLTPHLGASTHEAKRNVSVEMAEQVVQCLKKGIALNGVNVPRIAPADAATVGPYLTLARNLGGFLAQVVDGTLQSVRVTVQGAIAEPAMRPICVAALVGALHPSTSGAVTPVNAERIAKDRSIRVHCEQSSMKRDFMNLLRVEAVFDETRHCVSGSVFGHRHGRLLEFDEYTLDAIPEGPLVVTFHDDEPGVVGKIGTLLGEAGINISRMQIGTADDGEGAPAIAVLNLDRALADGELARLRALRPIRRVCQVQ